MRVSLMGIPSGDSGTYRTLAIMRQVARGGAINPLVRQTAVDLAYGMGTNPLAQARTIRAWLEQNTLFQRDPYGVEAIHTPEAMIRQVLTSGRASVDCDDVAVLAASLGLTLGLRARFVTVGFHSPKSPYAHVWAELADPRRPVWIECDITRPAQGMSGAVIARRHIVEV